MLFESLGVKASQGGAPAAAPYQQWSGYPQSPVLTSAYPYQVIYQYDSDVKLLVATKPMYYNGGNLVCAETVNAIAYKIVTGAWQLVYTYTGIVPPNSITSTHNGTLYECNNDIYTNSTLLVVYKAKTTP